MFKLWSVPKAAPVLLRHIAAYIELAALDIARANREFKARVIASIVVAICGLFTLLMVCLLVLAYTWDTPYRIAAVAWMLAAFALFTIIAMVMRSNSVRSQSLLLADAKKQWAEDRVLLEKLFPQHEEAGRD